MSDRMDVNRLLMEMRAMRAQSSAFGGVGAMAERDRALAPGAVNNTSPKFGDLMSQAINAVNETQQNTSSLQKAFIRGEPGVDVTDVMIASQKSSVAFDSMMQVRNKLVEAYKDVMNMPI